MPYPAIDSRQVVFFIPRQRGEFVGGHVIDETFDHIIQRVESIEHCPTCQRIVYYPEESELAEGAETE